MRTYRSAYGPATSLAITPTTRPDFVSLTVAGGTAVCLSGAQARDLADQLLAICPEEQPTGIEGDNYIPAKSMDMLRGWYNYASDHEANFGSQYGELSPRLASDHEANFGSQIGADYVPAKSDG